MRVGKSRGLGQIVAKFENMSILTWIFLFLGVQFTSLSDVPPETLELAQEGVTQIGEGR